jgi:hypothetical protein
MEHEPRSRRSRPAPARGRLAPPPRTLPAPPAGNAALARFAAGAGVLPSGVVHPDVERAIAQRAGRGGRLDAHMGTWAKDALGLDPARVGVHHDEFADELSRAVSARAFTVRDDVFFAAGEYRPGTAAGHRLMAHELAHVAQQAGAATTGPLRVSEPGDAHERDADRVADELDG